MVPGSTALTVMPVPSQLRRHHLRQAEHRRLADLVRGLPARDLDAALDATTTIRPPVPPAIIDAAAARASRHGPRRLASSCACDGVVVDLVRAAAGIPAGCAHEPFPGVPWRPPQLRSRSTDPASVEVTRDQRDPPLPRVTLGVPAAGSTTRRPAATRRSTTALPSAPPPPPTTVTRPLEVDGHNGSSWIRDLMRTFRREALLRAGGCHLRAPRRRAGGPAGRRARRADQPEPGAASARSGRRARRRLHRTPLTDLGRVDLASVVTVEAELATPRSRSARAGSSTPGETSSPTLTSSPATARSASPTATNHTHVAVVVKFDATTDIALLRDRRARLAGPPLPVDAGQARAEPRSA